MAGKADFNAEEWAALVEGPLMAGMRVVAAGRGGTIRESLAMGKVYAEARRTHGDNDLLDALVASPPALDPQRLAGGGDVATVARQHLTDAMRIVNDKAPEDAEAYSSFVRSVARAAAEAHKEGGFIGIGGKPVSAEEQTALDEIDETLAGG